MELILAFHGCFIPQIAGTFARPLRGVFSCRSGALRTVFTEDLKRDAVRFVAPHDVFHGDAGAGEIVNVFVDQLAAFPLSGGAIGELGVLDPMRAVIHPDYERVRLIDGRTEFAQHASLQ